MQITHIYTGSDNQSYFEDIDILLKDGGAAGQSSELVKATGAISRETDGSYNSDFHNAPRRQYVVVLDDKVESEFGDGTKRIFRTEDILWQHKERD